MIHPTDVERLRGKWVACATADEGVVASADTLDVLHALLQSVEHQAVLERRIPQPDEPLFLGGALELRTL